MKRVGLLALAAITVLSACSAAPVPQREIPPPRPEWSNTTKAQQPADEEATRRFLDSEIQRRTEAGEPAPQPTNADRYRTGQDPNARRGATDEEATRRFLDAEIERRSYVPPAPQPERVVERGSEPAPGPQYRYDDVGRYEYQHYQSSFPWLTAVGAGAGAIIGHQSGNRGEGAAIGAGVGLLFDMVRWH